MAGKWFTRTVRAWRKRTTEAKSASHRRLEKFMKMFGSGSEKRDEKNEKNKENEERK
jgi:hypothetical protein